jgi:glycosyltransferase involved in cell wall biosynthesis
MISLHLLVKNEVDLLRPLVEHIRPYVEEVIVTDTGSTDGTLELAQEIADAAFFISLDLNFARARNSGIVRCREPWILSVDADEWPQTALLYWMTNFVRGADYNTDAVMVRRENLVGGKSIGDHTYEWHPRLFRKHLRYYGRIHEGISPKHVVYAPEDYLLLHHKSEARQQRQNVFYEQWK